MSAWRLNAFLTSWRAAIDWEFPHRTRLSDGTLGDLAHSKTVSEHNPDSDGSVDAYDCDLNLFGSSNPLGSVAEVKAMHELIAEFQHQTQAQLWIFQRNIANRDIGNWKVRAYAGSSPHDHHAHFQSVQTRERQPYTGDLDRVFTAINAKPAAAKLGSRTLERGMTGPDVAYVQRWLGIDDDGIFGPDTQAAVLAYQRMRGIPANGQVDATTWVQLGIR
jgi:hypothetical protein